MTIVIKQSTDLRQIEELLGKLPRRSKFDPMEFCGLLKLKESPLVIQKRLRDEWE